MVEHPSCGERNGQRVQQPKQKSGAARLDRSVENNLEQLGFRDGEGP